MTPLGRVLTERADGGAGVQLGEARRLFATIVGPGIAAGAEVTALRGATLVLAVRSEHEVRRIQSIEGFILRTLAERLAATRLRRIDYVCDRAAGEQRRMGIPEAQGGGVPDAATRLAIEGVIAGLADPLLRERLGAWMGVVLARAPQSTEGAPR